VQPTAAHAHLDAGVGVHLHRVDVMNRYFLAILSKSFRRKKLNYVEVCKTCWVISRVNRLSEFSPIGRLFYENYLYSQQFWAVSYRYEFRNLGFDTK
jgi:lysylphosphatidylglycerol synthetase-like protein (DUF2156 family)